MPKIERIICPGCGQQLEVVHQTQTVLRRQTRQVRDDGLYVTLNPDERVVTDLETCGRCGYVLDSRLSTQVALRGR